MTIKNWELSIGQIVFLIPFILRFLRPSLSSRLGRYLQHAVQRQPGVRSDGRIHADLVHDAALDFHPGVRSKRHVLRSDHHLRGNAAIFQEAGRYRGSLQTEHLLPIPDAGRINRRADLVDHRGLIAAWQA